jgi:hypothetical protein
LDHAGLAGQVRELLVKEILQPALPKLIEIATGVALVDHLGNQSPEVDVVLYDGSSLPPLAYGEVTKVVPVDAAIYAIEVKTTLNATEVKDALAKAEKIAALDYVPEAKVDGLPRSRVITALFGFNSDLKATPDHQKMAEAELDRITEYAPKLRHPEVGWIDGRWTRVEAPALRVICIPGRSYCYWGDLERDPQTGAPNATRWTRWLANEEEFDEAIAFVAGVSMTAMPQIGQRLTAGFGWYLIPE